MGELEQRRWSGKKGKENGGGIKTNIQSVGNLSNERVGELEQGKGYGNLRKERAEEEQGK